MMKQKVRSPPQPMTRLETKHLALFFFRQSVFGMTEKNSPLGAWGV